MNWKYVRLFPWLDTRARYVARAPRGGSLLDVATSNGETLGHMVELRPDLQYHAVDLAPPDPGALPPGTVFETCDVLRQPLPVDDNTLDMVTVMHLIEHLPDTKHLFGELARVIKPGGWLYLEFPHAKTLDLPSAPKDADGRALFTMNFHDDPTHLHVPDTAEVVKQLEHVGFTLVASGTSRNWLFFVAYLVYYCYAGKGRPRCTAHAHYRGWSAYVALRKAYVDHALRKVRRHRDATGNIE